MKLRAGQIVLVDWRDALPKGPNKMRPAVVEGGELSDPAYPNVIVVPLADATDLVIPDLSVPIEPAAETGCAQPFRAVAHAITTASKQRVRTTSSRITDAQLAELRHLVGVAIGLVDP